MVKKTKHIFFDEKIEETTNKKCRSSKFINWVKRRNILAIKAIQFNSKPCIELDNLWEALYKSFNSAQNCQVNIGLLDEIPDKITTIWASFSKKELHSTIENCNNSLAFGPDKLSWKHFKVIVKNKKCVNKLIDIANVCINLGHWPNHFKTLSMVIIPKLNKPSYDLPKSF